MDPLRFTLLGDPSTKKTSPRIITVPVKDGSGRPVYRNGEVVKRAMILPSQRYQEWFEGAMNVAPAIKDHCRSRSIHLPISKPVQVSAVVFLAKNYTGDLVGYLESVGDYLQSPRTRLVGDKAKLTRNGAGIILDDRLIASWDGSRLLVDPAKPRIEIEITLFDGPQMELFDMTSAHEEEEPACATDAQ